MSNQSKLFIAVIALTASVAHADVQIYGQLRTGIESEQKKIKGKPTETTTKIVDMDSRIGFKGRERLGDSLTALWQLESRVYTDGNAGTFGTRESYVGLESQDWGRVQLGYLESPLYAWNGRNLDAWMYNNNTLGVGTFAKFGDVVKRRPAVRYTTPNHRGFVGEFYVSPSDNYTERNARNENRDATLYGASLNYKDTQTGIFGHLTGGYINNGINNYSDLLRADGSRSAGYQVVAQIGISNNKWLAGAAVKHARDVNAAARYNADVFDTYSAANPTGTQTLAVSRANEVITAVAYRFDNKLRVKASAAYGFGIKSIQRDHNTGTVSLVKTGGNGKYVQGIVGVDYDLSKRSEWFSHVGYLKTGRGEQSVRQIAFGLGLRHRF